MGKRFDKPLFLAAIVATLFLLVSAVAESRPHPKPPAKAKAGKPVSFTGQFVLPRFGVGTEGGPAVNPGLPILGARSNALLSGDGPKPGHPWSLEAIDFPVVGFLATAVKTKIEPAQLGYTVNLYRGGSLVWVNNGILPLNLIEEQAGPVQFFMYSGSSNVAVDFNNPLLLRSGESLEIGMNITVPSVKSYVGASVGWAVAANGLSVVQATPGMISYVSAK